MNDDSSNNLTQLLSQLLSQADISSAQIHAYWDGSLDDDIFQHIDVWLSQQNDSVQEQLYELYGDDDNNNHNDTKTIPSSAASISLKNEKHSSIFISASNIVRFHNAQALGEGGMGIVTSFDDKALGRSVAMKTCKARGIHESPDLYLARKARLEREVAILALLDHPAITPIYDVGTDGNGHAAYIMKRIEGQVLDAYVASQDKPARFWVTLIIRIAEAVAFAHSKNIIHRDIKPANIIVGTYGEITVADWGIAASIGEDTENIIHGTPTWMSPEQANGAEPAASMDIWSIGAILFYCLTKNEPSTYNRSGDDNDSANSAQYWQKIPPRLKKVLQSCLAHDINARPSSVSALIDDLRHWLTYGVIQSDTLGPYRRINLWRKKHPKTMLALSTCMLLAVVIFATNRTHQHQHFDQMLASTRDLVETVSLNDISALHLAQQQITTSLLTYPHDHTLQSAYERFATALTIIKNEQQLNTHKARIQSTFLHYHHSGRWVNEVSERLNTLSSIGLPSLSTLSTTKIETFSNAVRQHQLRTDITINLLYAYTAARLDERFKQQVIVTSHTLHTVLQKICAGDKEFSALLRLLQTARLGPHEPELVDYVIDNSLPIIAHSPKLVDVLLSIVSPDDKLVELAQQRTHHEANAYWPNIFLARMALFEGQYRTIREHALIAHGNFPDCLWSALLLAYAELLEGRYELALTWVQRAQKASPENIEAAVLSAAIHAKNGDDTIAIQLLTHPHIAAHVRYHILKPHGHPMERACNIIRDTGIIIPTGPARLGPLIAPLQNKHK